MNNDIGFCIDVSILYTKNDNEKNSIIATGHVKLFTKPWFLYKELKKNLNDNMNNNMNNIISVNCVKEISIIVGRNLVYLYKCFPGFIKIKRKNNFT